MHGILIVNKPKGYTSQDVVSKVKKVLNIKKAGHTGTLDPLATGVLPIMLGEYTKLSKYLIEHNKTYIAKVRLGEKSSTGDLEGTIIEKKDVDFNKINDEYISKILESFTGKQYQKPPMYSAIKINGKKLYEYAREGTDIEVPERGIEIFSIKLINIVNNEIEFEVSCSKGTYIRVLCEDIANKLGTVGLMSSLVRTEVDIFKISDAISLEELEKNKSNIEQFLVDMEDIFKNFDKITLDSKELKLFINGVNLKVDKINGTYNIYSDNEYLGIGIVNDKLLKRDVIIQ